jgi:hypothetical protein
MHSNGPDFGWNWKVTVMVADPKIETSWIKHQAVTINTQLGNR